MTQNIFQQKQLLDRYKRIQNVCDSLLERMEVYFDQNLILEDPKELLRLDTLLKVRSKLLDFEREIRLENEVINNQTQHQNREFLINDIITKIKQATGD